MEASKVEYIKQFLSYNGYQDNQNNTVVDSDFTMNKNGITVSLSDEQIRFEIGKSINDGYDEIIDSGMFLLDTNIIIYVSPYCLTHNLGVIEESLYSSLDQITI
ncbi:hypothetical protein WAF17_21025 [Bernardetia sp. ABR2-2B]|uniref:hypothetical protein n=1 Tax=Bernardetia sp. ABR2-2B TaxID=3127472 RepID=UPI0030D2E185